MLYNSFFNIKEFIGGDSSFNIKIIINKEHPVFVGHFPGQPVVPGVFALQMIKECLEQSLSQKLKYSAVTNCKFSNVIIPGEDRNFNVTGSYDESGSDVFLKASIKSENHTYLSLKATLSIIENSIG